MNILLNVLAVWVLLMLCGLPLINLVMYTLDNNVRIFRIEAYWLVVTVYFGLFFTMLYFTHNTEVWWYFRRAGFGFFMYGLWFTAISRLLSDKFVEKYEKPIMWFNVAILLACLCISYLSPYVE